MSGLPEINGERLIRALRRAGFVERKGKGSHRILVHAENPQRRAVVPVHGNKQIKPGTLISILSGAGLTVEEIKKLI